MSDVEVILVAGGTGRRFGGAVPKQFQPLGGRPMLAVAASRFVGVPDIARLIVVVADEERERCARMLESLALPIRFASAGAERQRSVARGIAALDPSCAIVAVHDAARPLVRSTDVAACIAAARTTGAAILATPVLDSVKRVRDGRIVATVPRADLWLAQTPQVFAADLLRRAHVEAPRDEVATDDAALVERLGVEVAIVPGHPSNRKITTREDLAWAERVLAASAG
ncbi:MAG: 2-C-methyl-D-erythritol 4-phosphate cytidylyltransferase [Deltaproteobacteria bacterium]|nr:2-C-methyl-D-erythritol 4-phosphate cytidylyltransferase [Deltaproteobacteria bacterium]